jgi:hypothetical protein
MFFAKSKNKELLETIFSYISNSKCSYITIGISIYGLEITTEYSDQKNYIFYVFLDCDEFIDYKYISSHRNSYFTVEVAPIFAFLKQSVNNYIEISIDSDLKLTISQSISNSRLVYSYPVDIEYSIPYSIHFYDYDIEMEIYTKKLLSLISNDNLDISANRGVITFHNSNTKYICDGIEKQFRIKNINGEIRTVKKLNDYRLLRIVDGKATINCSQIIKFKSIFDMVSTIQLNIMLNSHIRIDMLLDSDIGTVAHIFLEIE